MNRLRIAAQRLKKPSGGILVSAYILTALSVAGALAALLLGFMADPLLSIIAYVLFAISALSLAYTVYTVVIYSRYIKSWVKGLLYSNPISKKMIESFGFRTVIAATFSFFGSLIYAIFNGVLGIVFSSIWYGALASYYIFLSITRGGLLVYHRRRERGDEVSEGLIRARKYRTSGIFLLVLNIALSAAIAQMIFDDRFFSYPGWIIYAFAAYAFTKMTFSIINMFRSRQQDDLTVRGIRDINLLDAVVSILALQTALLHTFSQEGSEVSISGFNTVTGIFVSVFSIGFSIYIIVKAQKIINQMKAANSNG